MRRVLEIGGDLHATATERQAKPEILNHVFDDRRERLHLEIGPRSNLTEAIRDAPQPFDVELHVLKRLIELPGLKRLLGIPRCRTVALNDLDPAHQ